ncbi:lung seven transmembrane receptor-domain-containing protein [Glomus cerebriforme]|uniref:Lung seven transmembrane receptor-domain-containing protein n=1 Tax=Glomus cerebriforme TaxID=658196 RepID=A0A397T498_9GLOM|nr:lung seven transmembrane receptor-domain-containing protein [Glomus cerebriforme]
MVRLTLWLLLTLLVVWITCISANEEDLINTSNQKCSGMFEKSTVPGGGSSVIKLKWNEQSTGDVAAVISEWKDIYKIGHKSEEGKDIYICDKYAIDNGYCSKSQENNFIVPENETTSIVTHFFNSTSKDTYTFDYPINKTGFYCVVVGAIADVADDVQYIVTVDWRNPYGELPAQEYPKLPFYGLLSLIYLAIGIVWMALSIIHWRDILPVQNYISGVILFLMLEMAFNWGYWENYNSYGHPSAFLLILVAILNAGRNSISFFMLLIVCMGYGVVKPTLGSTMNKCRALAATHFLFGIIYSAGTMLLDPDTANPLVFLVIFPLAFTMTAFYIWTLQSITNTLQTLEIRKQNVKSLMYKRLYRLLVFSVSILGVFFFINMINYLRREDPDWIPTYWRWRWFLLDGWLNILYLIVFCVILVIWRPTRNNKRFAMSDELAQEDPNDLEINTLRAAGNIGYDNVKYRSETDRLHDDNGSAIFDIGDEHDDDDDDDFHNKWDDESTVRASHGDSSSSHEVTSQRVNNDENQDHIEQEISKLN